MSYIHVPSAFSNDAAIYGPLLWPFGDVQQENYRNAIEAQAGYASNPRGRWSEYEVFNNRVGHNLAILGRRFMPFAILDHPADVIKPYAPWQIYTFLIFVKDDGSVGRPWSTLCQIGGKKVFDERDLRGVLQTFRRFRHEARHPADILALDEAIKECLYEIDSALARQRKRREPR